MKRKSEKTDSKQGEEDDVDFEPKLTRSKAKKLLQERPNIVWPITPLKKITQNDLDLFNEELPEESDDEEYKPNLDDLQDQSEEESGRQSVVSTVSHSSALEISVCQYLENFDDNLLENDSLKCSSDHLFKVPGDIPIGQRTRSKLCLSDTPLEAIEKAFVPPDITTDMYDFNCDNEDWKNFLKEFMQPLSNDLEDDDEADPEYNALADEEEMYKEELRRDKAVKISRKELRKLMAELFECPDELSSDEEEEKRVKIEITNKVDMDIEEKKKSEEKVVEKKSSALMTNTQILLLQQQLRQHVQLTTQHFLQTCDHPLYGDYAKDCKIILATLIELSRAKNNSDSVYNIYNLEPAFNLIEDWEKFLMSKDGDSVKMHMREEIEKAKKAKKKRNYHKITFHPSLLKLMSESYVFLYPLLLPPCGFRCDGPFRTEFVLPEDSLIAIGLEEFGQYLVKNPRWFDRWKHTEKAACELLCDYLMPVKKVNEIRRHITDVKGNESNPIHYFRQNKKAPKTLHFLIPFNEHLKKRPCDRPKPFLPEIFWNFIEGETNKKGTKDNDHG